MSKRDSRVLVFDMLEAVESILNYTTDLSFDSYLEDRKTQDAVLRNLTVLGEAAGRVDQEFQRLNPQIEWQKIARSRNIVVHDYFAVDHEIIWKIITVYLPPLLANLKAIAA